MASGPRTLDLSARGAAAPTPLPHRSRRFPGSDRRSLAPDMIAVLGKKRRDALIAWAQQNEWEIGSLAGARRLGAPGEPGHDGCPGMAV